MPWTRSSALRSRIRLASVSGETSPPGSWWNDSMPTSAESSRFIRTYMADAGSSPTRIVASPGFRAMAPTPRATRSRTRAATALPSMTRALTVPQRFAATRPSSLLEGRIVGHQLAFAPVAREPHHNESAGLHPGDPPLAKVRVYDVLAESERRARAGRLGDRRPAPCGGRVRAGGRLLVTVGELHRDLVDEAAAHVPVAPAEEAARARVGEVQLALGPGDPDVAEPPLLLDVARLDRTDVREDPVLETDDEHRPELEPFGVVRRHEREQTLLVAQGVLLGEERDLLQELLDRALVGGGVVLPRHSHELLEVLEPSLCLDRALGTKALRIRRLVERLLQQVADPRAGLGALPQSL